LFGFRKEMSPQQCILFCCLNSSSAWYCLCFSLQEFPRLASVRNQIWRHHGGPALNMQGSPSHDKTDACNPTARSGSGPCCAFHISSPSSRSSSFAALSLSRKGSKFGDLSRAAAAGMYTESPTRGAPNAANCARIWCVRPVNRRTGHSYALLPETQPQSPIRNCSCMAGLGQGTCLQFCTSNSQWNQPAFGTACALKNASMLITFPTSMEMSF
jgi:hypothetical protein